MPRRSGISIVLPAFNEEPNVHTALNAATRMADRLFERHEVILVDDGSRDGTGAVAQEAAARDPRIRVIGHPSNLGYGAALRTGVAAATQDLVLLTDADNQFDLTEVELLLDRLPGADAVIGYRINRSEGLHRRFGTATWRLAVRAALGISFRDIDCAFKLFRRPVVQALTLVSVGATISAEVLARLVQGGCRVEEVGVHHFPRTAGRATGMHPAVIGRAFAELFALRRLIAAERVRLPLPATDPGPGRS